MHDASDVLSFVRKDGTIVMEQDKCGKVNVTDKDFAKKIKEKHQGVVPGEDKANKNDERE